MIVGSGTNAYVIQDNFLVYGKGSEELTGIANNIYGKIRELFTGRFLRTVKETPVSRSEMPSVCRRGMRLLKVMC